MTNAGTVRLRVPGSVVVVLVIAASTVDPTAAQDRPRPAAEFTVGWVGFAYNGIVSEGLVGGAARWYLNRTGFVGGLIP